MNSRYLRNTCVVFVYDSIANILNRNYSIKYAANTLDSIDRYIKFTNKVKNILRIILSEIYKIERNMRITCC